jgi:uncharacterized protein (DUF433 family)
LSRWAFGHSVESTDYAPIVHGAFAIDKSYLVTFAGLVELFTIAALRQKDISLPAIRRAYDRAKSKYGPEPFASREYKSTGKGVFSPGDDAVPDMEELTSGRIAFKEIIEPLLENVSYVDNKAAMYSPLGTSRSVVLDPERSFGAPINRSKGVRTAILHGMARNEPVDVVADWYNVSLQGVRDAIEYETALLAAA